MLRWDLVNDSPRYPRVERAQKGGSSRPALLPLLWGKLKSSRPEVNSTPAKKEEKHLSSPKVKSTPKFRRHSWWQSVAANGWVDILVETLWSPPFYKSGFGGYLGGLCLQAVILVEIWSFSLWISRWGQFGGLPAINHLHYLRQNDEGDPTGCCSNSLPWHRLLLWKCCLEIPMQKTASPFPFFPPSAHHWVVQLKSELSHHCHLGRQVIR